ncbi:DUF6542 domain-containing protein [Streptomyces sp. NPDC002004]
MEQHTTRTPQYRPRRTAPLPPQGGPRGSVAVRRAVAGPRRPVPWPVRAVRAVRAVPNPRLTGLGVGLFCSALMFLLGAADQALLDGAIAVYGVLFLLVSALTAHWVRPADLVTAPVAVPIAFAVGLLPLAEGEGGIGAQAMALFTALAVHAGWLYGGTLVAGVITTVRKVRLMARKRQQRAGQGPRPRQRQQSQLHPQQALQARQRQASPQGGRPRQGPPGPRRRPV